MMRGGLYFDERQQKKRRRILKLKIYGGIAAFFVLLIGAGYLIAYSPLFRIKDISIQYLEAQPHDINRQFLEVKPPLINDLKNFFTNRSKIAEFLGPENILIWKQEKIGEFLKNRPEISEITIKKNYFKRRIEIGVKERERFGVWCQQSENATCWWFDRNGILFAETLNVEGQLINKVADFSDRQLNLGDKALDDKFFQNLIKIFEVLERSGLKIKSLKLENLEFQEAITESSPTIFFSLRFAPDSALEVIKSLKDKGLEGIEYIDLRVENRVYYK